MKRAPSQLSTWGRGFRLGCSSVSTLTDDVEDVRDYAEVEDDESSAPSVMVEDDVLSEEAKDFVHKLVTKILAFMEVLVGHPLYPYQQRLAYRIVESVVLNDGDTITALMSRQSGKALATDTPILTTDGWRTMGDLRVGMKVYAPDGTPTRITDTSMVFTDHDCFRVTFADGQSVVADADHRWTLWDAEKQEEVTVTTRALSEKPRRYSNNGRDCYRHRVSLPAPIERPEADLPLDPYLLGVWLGDGSSSKAEVTTADWECVAPFLDAGFALGYTVAAGGKSITYGFRGGLYAALRELGLLRATGRLDGRKHIPEQYLLASPKQRLALLRGLMDSDGHCTMHGEVEFSSTNLDLAEGVLFLSRSLGWKATLREGRSTLRGVDCGTKYRVCWTPYAECSPFSLERKSARVRVRPEQSWRARRTEMLALVAVEPVATVNTKCIAVEHPSRLYLAGRGLVPTHNTETVADVIATLMILLPRLATRFPTWLEQFKGGVMVGCFAPVEEQAQTLFARITQRLSSERAIEIMAEPDINDEPEGGGKLLSLKNCKSFVRLQTAHERANIESKTYHIIVIDEAQRADERVVRKCVAAGTPVWTPDGVLPVERVVADKRPVLTYSPTEGFVEADPVEFHDNGLQPVWRVTLSSGRQIDATANHRWLVNENRRRHWREASTAELQTSMSVPLALRAGRFGQRGTWEEGYLLGQLLGDGCLVNGVQWCGMPDASFDLMVEIAASKGARWVEHHRQPSGLREGKFSTPGNGTNPLTRWLRQEGVYGLKGTAKALLHTDYSREAVSGIVSGLLDSDGSVGKHRVEFASISERLVRQVSDLLLALGVRSSIFCRPNNGGFGANPHPLWVLTVKASDAVIRLSEVVSLHSGEKAERLSALTTVMRAKRGRMAAEDVAYDRIVDVSYLGVRPTYCVTVEPFHTVVWNGVVGLQSIHPMVASTNGTIIKTGTPDYVKGDFHKEIQHNKRTAVGRGGKQNHFEADWREVCKYNARYKKFIAKEIQRIGEESDEFQLSYCVDPETRILTADLHHIPARDVVRGMRLVGFEENRSTPGEHRKFQETVVEDVGVVQRPCYRVHLSDGTSVVCSTEHQWLVSTAGRRTVWKTTASLSVGSDRMFRVSDVWEADDTRSGGFLAAAFDGEGCLARTPQGRLSGVSFTQKTNAMLDQVRKHLSEHGYLSWETVPRVDGVTRLHLTGGKNTALRFLGEMRPPRLLSKFTVESMGSIGQHDHRGQSFEHPQVVGLESLGVRDVVAIRTTSRTYVAEGLASHNCLRWLLERGMFTTEETMDALGDKGMEIVKAWKRSPLIAGLDVARKQDSTVCTVLWVDWNNPDEFGFYDHRVLNWLEIHGDRWEEQYAQIVDFLAPYDVMALGVDGQGMGDLFADRMSRLLPNVTVQALPSTGPEQSKRWKYLTELMNRRLISWPAHAYTRRLRVYKRFYQQMLDAERNYKGGNMVVAAPKEADAHDDYVDSLALGVWLTREATMPTVEVSNSEFYSGSQRRAG